MLVLIATVRHFIYLHICTAKLDWVVVDYVFAISTAFLSCCGSQVGQQQYNNLGGLFILQIEE